MNPTRRRSLLLPLALLALPSIARAQPERYLAGRDYTVIANPVPDHTPTVVEVTEFFWYGCPGCYAFEPQLADWVARQREQVVCLRLPAIWSDLHEVHARAYYTARALGVLADLHGKLFTALHVEGKRLQDESELAAFFTGHGVNRDDFTKTYHSFTVQSEINRAKNLAVEYGARATPSLIVNGKYLVNLSRDTLDIVDFLVRKELM